jgi:hypothetical protein
MTDFSRQDKAAEPLHIYSLYSPTGQMLTAYISHEIEADPLR